MFQIVITARKKFELRSQGSRAKVKQVLTSITVTSNFIIFNKTALTVRIIPVNAFFGLRPTSWENLINFGRIALAVYSPVTQ